MSLQKLAKELDETGRQTAEMLEGISEALSLLAQKPQGENPTVMQAMQLIITALQGQDRIEQRCRNMALAARQFAMLPASTPESVYAEIWESLTLDELRVPELSGVAKNHSHGDVDLF